MNTATQTGTKKAGKVLVVDDEKIVRNLVKRKLELDGFRVTTARHAEEALELLGTNLFQLIFTDLKMPGLDGIQLLKRIKDLDQDIEVIIMTGYASTETAIEAVRGGAFDYIRKPFEHIEELGLKARQAFEKHLLVRQRRAMLARLNEVNQALKSVVVRKIRELNLTQEGARREKMVLKDQMGGLDELIKSCRDGLSDVVERLMALDGQLEAGPPKESLADILTVMNGLVAGLKKNSAEPARSDEESEQ